MNFPLTSTVHMVHLIISLPFATSHLSHPLVCPSPCLISPSHLVLPSPSPISIRHLVYLPHTTCSSVFFLCLHHVCIFPCYSLCWVGLFFLLLSRSSPCHFNNKSCAFPLFFFSSPFPSCLADMGKEICGRGCGPCYWAWWEEPIGLNHKCRLGDRLEEVKDFKIRVLFEIEGFYKKKNFKMFEPVKTSSLK